MCIVSEVLLSCETFNPVSCEASDTQPSGANPAGCSLQGSPQSFESAHVNEWEWVFTSVRCSFCHYIGGDGGRGVDAAAVSATLTQRQKNVHVTF